MNIFRWTLGALVVVALLSDGSARGSEVPNHEVTPDEPRYGGFRFAVHFEEMEVMHDQFKVYWIVLTVVPEARQHVELISSVNVWTGNQFVYSGTLHAVGREWIPIQIRERIAGNGTLIFPFSLNPDFIEGTWLSYPIRRDDGSVEMNCIVSLKDFIEE